MDVGIFGAGAIGCFVGTVLSHGGARVFFLGRQSLLDNKTRMQATLLDGTTLSPRDDAVFTTSAEDLAECDVILVTVKSQDTEQAARELGSIIDGPTTVVSFQNGLRNPGVLRRQVGSKVVGGVVTFNVYRDDGWVFHQATSGDLHAGDAPGSDGTRLQLLQKHFEHGGLHLELEKKIERVMAGKLVFNLNNGVCAATGVTIQESLQNQDARRLFAHCMSEGIAVLKANNLAPRSPLSLPIPFSWIPKLLSLPDAILLRVARQVVKADPHARSSTLQDLQAGVETEIDHLNGEIVALGEKAGVPTPANRLVVETIRQHESALQDGRTPEWADPAELLSQL